MTWYDLSAFVDQREQLLEESFQALSPDELGILTPVELQHIPMGELKALCLDELRKLPNERVLAILQGPTSSFARKTAFALFDQHAGTAHLASRRINGAD
ncbi:hypothetical protein IscW_ISCW015309 [Ixodes scapularis]|uniref:Uncharacterized protein n=1 Tax=Ixodes scapularis TaxID=6945 RepID=B7QMN4_IXOSC|nr:hypothetical protein IscW_ISCW015309 [Ixodes scapularis]|eukprot:XP_002399942.1 hypothetical protein IscW_ISCW015309 [Ixodes scapularis]